MLACIRSLKANAHADGELPRRDRCLCPKPHRIVLLRRLEYCRGREKSPSLRSCRRVIRMAESVLFVEVGKGRTKVDGALPCFRRQKSSLSVQFPLQMVSEFKKSVLYSLCITSIRFVSPIFFFFLLLTSKADFST